MDWKQVVFQQLKMDGEEGKFSALFAPFNVVDKHGDLTMPGAFGSQQVIVSAYGHGSWREGIDVLPVGRGRIFDGEKGGVVEGQFFLNTIAGRETYLTIKGLGDLQEWSYALPEIDYEMRTIDGENVRVLKKIKVNEVSPVLMGAGIGTHTMDIKKAVSVHHTATEGGAWDAGANEKRLPSGKDAAFYKQACAWQNSDGDPSVKSSWKFIHHFVGTDGDPSAASTRACSAGIAVLNGGRGGANIPDADREGVWRHLAAHLRDADMEPPELRSMDASPKNLSLFDHLELVVVDAEEAIERLKARAEIRESEDRHPSTAALKRGLLIKARLEDLARAIGEIAEKHDPLSAEIVRFEEMLFKTRRAS